MKSDQLTFTAIDFETASYARTSACAVGLARVERGRIVGRAYHLIRPPSRRFVFSYLHGITWAMVSARPTFAELWPRLARYFEGATFLAAHNAPFDASVLAATCAHYGLAAPTLPFTCTLRVARSWGLRPANLRATADYLGIPLTHHHAGSDAEACARIVLAS